MGAPPDPSGAAAARDVLARYLSPTRLVRARAAGGRGGPEVHLKLESEQPTGSFKVRGAIHALSRAVRRGRITEVVASSTGNHGAAVAYAAGLLGVQATVFLPRDANPVKTARIAELGARIVAAGRDLADAHERAAEHARRAEACYLQDAIDPDVPPGAGTIALEVLDQIPSVDALYVPVGDTALIRGIAAAAKPRRPGLRIVGVQAEGAPSYFLSWSRGTAVSTDSADTIADGLATRCPVEANVRAIRELVDDMVLVTDDAMLAAIRRLLLEDHVVAEPAGAAPLAAFHLRADRETARTVVLVVSGSNVAPDVLQRALEHDTRPSREATSRGDDGGPPVPSR